MFEREEHASRVTRILPHVLTARDLPIAELSACLLDGEVEAVLDGMRPIDTVDDPVSRSHALRGILGDGYIPMGRTAAWVYGVPAVGEPVLTVCCDRERRVQRRLPRAVRVRELLLKSGDTVRIGPLAVTSPLRTVFDLIGVERGEESERQETFDIARGLVVRFGLTTRMLDDRLQDSGAFPGRLTVVDGIRRLASASTQPALTR